MTDTPFKPTVYFKPACPFCFKLRLFLLEAGLIDTVDLVEWTTPESQAEIGAKLAAHLEKVTYPAAEVSPGKYVADSDALIALFGAPAGIDPANLPTYQAYLAGPFDALGKLFMENMDLKKKLG